MQLLNNIGHKWMTDCKMCANIGNKPQGYFGILIPLSREGNFDPGSAGPNFPNLLTIFAKIFTA